MIRGVKYNPKGDGNNEDNMSSKLRSTLYFFTKKTSFVDALQKADSKEGQALRYLIEKGIIDSNDASQESMKMIFGRKKWHVALKLCHELIYGEEMYTLEALARATGQSINTVSRTLPAFERLGLVERIKNESQILVKSKMKGL